MQRSANAVNFRICEAACSDVYPDAVNRCIPAASYEYLVEHIDCWHRNRQESATVQGFFGGCGM
jgi:hypothetical protein